VACYQTCSKCAPKNTPGILALRDGTLQVFDWVTNLGTRVCRDINHPGGGGLSVHACARAFDAGVPRPHGKMGKGKIVAQAYADHADELDLQFIVYGQRKWGCSYSEVGAVWPDEWLPYGGYNHWDHVHAELNITGAAKLTKAHVVEVLGEGFLMALTDAEQKALKAKVERIDRNADKLVVKLREQDALLKKMAKKLGA
jgi:hypothetical protein